MAVLGTVALAALFLGVYVGLVIGTHLWERASRGWGPTDGV